MGRWEGGKVGLAKGRRTAQKDLVSHTKEFGFYPFPTFLPLSFFFFLNQISDLCYIDILQNSKRFMDVAGKNKRIKLLASL